MGSRLAAYRNEIARLHAENNELREIIRLLKQQIADMEAAHAEEMARLRAELAALSPEPDGAAPEEVRRLKAELAQVKKELEGRTGRLRRYENSTTPGRHGYGEDRARIHTEEQRMLAGETGDAIPENHKIGPPDGHPGARNQPRRGRAAGRDIEGHPGCGNAHLKPRRPHGRTATGLGGGARADAYNAAPGARGAPRHAPHDLQAQIPRHIWRGPWHRGAGPHPGVRGQEERRRGHRTPHE